MKNNIFLIACLLFVISATAVNAQSVTNNNDSKITTEVSDENNATNSVEEKTDTPIKKSKCAANLKSNASKSCCTASK
ncbi:MAG: hypothetical protein HKO56_08915, partial [Bacteroidia bacterium]|nr:hypothetical protein [Bacteroidia bacterium]